MKLNARERRVNAKIMMMEFCERGEKKQREKGIRNRIDGIPRAVIYIR